MSTISTSEQLLLPFYLVLKKTSRSFGLCVKETLFKPANVFIAASKSGKLITQHFQSSQMYFYSQLETSVCYY